MSSCENSSKLNQIIVFPVYPVVERAPINPCHPSPCGPNSVCRPQNADAICSCLPNYIGRAPNCRPECTMDSDCPTTLACICDKCQNPCNGACAPNSHCTVLYHRAHCLCDDGFTGDPYTGCSPPILCKNLFEKCCSVRLIFRMICSNESISFVNFS